MSVAKKLQLRPGQRVRMIGAPADFRIDAPMSDAAEAGAILLFASDSGSLKTRGKPFFEAARKDRLAWIAYPKAGKLGTDLNRDRLRELLRSEKIQPVRQVSLDETWSAMRFRPLRQ